MINAFLPIEQSYIMYDNKNNQDVLLSERRQHQLNQTLELIKKVLKNDLLAVYLYGSAVVGGLQKYSDLDLFVVSQRALTSAEKKILIDGLLKISGIYMKSSDLPIEITVVEHAQINPWQYPPMFDFQYGEWLRAKFEQKEYEPWSCKEMPDLAIIITQILLASKTLIGADASMLLSPVPYEDFIHALTHSLPLLRADLEADTRNVLLTLARIWYTMATNKISSKIKAADWAINLLPDEYPAVLIKARAICAGEEKESWDDDQKTRAACADFMIAQIHNHLNALYVLPAQQDKRIMIGD